MNEENSENILYFKIFILLIINKLTSINYLLIAGYFTAVLLSERCPYKGLTQEQACLLR
jgi:hypothetical protein